MAEVDRKVPDLVILDIMLEEDDRTSGFELCKTFKADERTAGVPILMVTALNELQHIEEGVEVGTDDFLTKPVNRVEVLARVRSLLKVRHLQSELARTLAYLNELEK
jgi:DNA-binding response OmpR family regulator